MPLECPPPPTDVFAPVLTTLIPILLVVGGMLFALSFLFGGRKAVGDMLRREEPPTPVAKTRPHRPLRPLHVAVGLLLGLSAMLVFALLQSVPVSEPSPVAMSIHGEQFWFNATDKDAPTMQVFDPSTSTWSSWLAMDGATLVRVSMPSGATATSHWSLAMRGNVSDQTVGIAVSNVSSLSFSNGSWPQRMLWRAAFSGTCSNAITFRVVSNLPALTLRFENAPPVSYPEEMLAVGLAIRLGGFTGPPLHEDRDPATGDMAFTVPLQWPGQPQAVVAPFGTRPHGSGTLLFVGGMWAGIAMVMAALGVPALMRDHDYAVRRLYEATGEWLGPDGTEPKRGTPPEDS